MGERTDRELVEQAQRGDLSAIAELFSRYWRAARAAAFGVTGEAASAEDAAAEAFSQALAGIDSLRDPDRFGSWLRTIVVRQARTACQSRQSPLDNLSVDPIDPSESHDEALARLQLGVFVQKAVRRLPRPLREAMALVYFEGYDSDVAARFLDIPATTLRRRLHDGRVRLRSNVEQILQGNKEMYQERERQLQTFRTMIENGEIYQALRGSLALRPPPSEVIDMLLRRQTNGSANDATTGVDYEMLQRFLRPSERASDPAHPVGSIVAAIRTALPEFQDWPLDVGVAATRFFSPMGKHHDRLNAVLPAPFAEGRPGAFLRVTRAVLTSDESGRVHTVYEHLQNSPDERTFAHVKNHMRLSDVIDLTWMVEGVLDLRSVQKLLEELSSNVLPDSPVRFSAYDEPRYRSALQFFLGGAASRAGYGGVLAEWAGRPSGVDAAHVRIFLEPWATFQSGSVVDFDRIQEKGKDC